MHQLSLLNEQTSSLGLGENADFFTTFLKPLVRSELLEGQSICLFGPPGVGKTVFCENLVRNSIADGLRCLYITLVKSPDDVRTNLQLLGIKTRREERGKRLVFVDGFNWLVGESQEGYHIDNLGNLTELSIQIASAACDVAESAFVIFDSVSPLSVYNPENAVVKFLQILLARIKDWRGIGLLVVQQGVHSQEFCNTLGYLVDGTLEMKIEEESGEITRYFRIQSLKSMAHDTRWVPFNIEANRNFKLKKEGGR